ncbi:MAG: DMT family transporter [Verrucomicrobia bacterium]|nr:DMT family transporter [Verrucomicrobiota bacterium]
MPSDLTSGSASNPNERPGGTLGALSVALGATAIGLAPLWIRLSVLGPFSTAAYRLLFASPLFWIWWRLESRRSRIAGLPAVTAINRQERLGLLFAGLMFAGDIALWNWSLHETSVANSTLITNLTPLLVMVAAWLLFGEKVTSRYFAALPIGLAGVCLLVHSPATGAKAHWKGDLLSGAATVFYAGYLLALRGLRQRFTTSFILFHSGWISAIALFVVAWAGGEKLWPATNGGWWIILALAFVSQLCGQGLIAFGFGHVSAALGSLILLIQPVVAAGIAWAWLGEPMTAWQLAGGALVLTAITIAARPQRAEATKHPSPSRSRSSS